MEIKLNETEILKIARVAGSIAGIADSMHKDLIPTDNRRKSLYELSEDLMEILHSKVNEVTPISSEIADKNFKE